MTLLFLVFASDPIKIPRARDLTTTVTGGGTMKTISWEDFLDVELRVGVVTHVERFPQAKKPAYKLRIDFGDPIGVRKSSAQITDLYDPDELVGTQVVAVVNFPPKQIGPFMSECLVTGFHDASGRVVLARPEREVPLGTRLA